MGSACKSVATVCGEQFFRMDNGMNKGELIVTHPVGYELDEKYIGKTKVTHHQDEALKNADFIYVKNWSSYTLYGKVITDDPMWMLNKQKLRMTNNASVMHCLPVRRNVELSDEILDSPNSVVTQQAGNRVWAAQAVLSHILRSI